MANKVQKPCKICGKMFTPCADCENDKTMFHWKRVACSPACAKEYFAKVEASRQAEATNAESQPVGIGNTEAADPASEVPAENVKPERTGKKNIKYKESEQID